MGCIYNYLKTMGLWKGSIMKDVKKNIFVLTYKKGKNKDCDEEVKFYD